MLKKIKKFFFRGNFYFYFLTKDPSGDGGAIFIEKLFIYLKNE
jgi:hypothetical protein